jgi:glycosyltransferase involved in cell wall biosynthesis
MHGSVLGLIAVGGVSRSDAAGRDVLEVGSLDVNGSVRPLIESHRPASYIGIDLEAGPGVDEVLDATSLVARFGLDAFDVVVCCEMLEHCADPAMALSNMVGVLRPGGVLIVSTRSDGFAYHHPPDRWRYTQATFAELSRIWELETLLLCDDPEYPGVFYKARRPAGPLPIALAPRMDYLPGITPMADPLRLLMLPANPDGCGYYRMWQPAAQLVRRHVVHIPAPNPHGLYWPSDTQAASYDAIIAQRVSGSDGLAAWQRWKGGPKLVYETDDHLLAPDRSALPHLHDSATAKTVIEALATSDLVTTSTEPLAAALRQHTDADVVAIEDHIRAELLTMERPRRDRLTIAYAGALNHAQDVELIRRPVRSLLHRHRDVDLHCLGWDFTPVFGRVRYTPWQPNVWDYYGAVDADIWLCPLRPTPFNRTRSHIKALEAMALGIPVVASDLEPYAELVEDGVTGYLVKTQAQWTEAIETLIADRELATQMGQAGRKKAGAWTIQDGWTAWSDAYERVTR